MNNLVEDIKNEISNNQIASNELVLKYITNYIKENKLSKYLKKVDFMVDENFRKVNCAAAYNFNDKVLYIDRTLSIEQILKSTFLDKKDKFDINDISLIYALYLSYIRHELQHIKQNSLISKFSLNLEYSLLRDSIYIHDKNYNFYMENHNLFPTEQNAYFYSLLDISNLFMNNEMLKSKEVINQFNRLICSVIISSYDICEDIIISPTQSFYTELGLYKRYNRIYKNLDLNPYYSLAYGMPIPNEIYNDINSVALGEKEVTNVKKLIKEV